MKTRFLAVIMRMATAHVSALAAMTVVTTTDDSGPSSLREAFASAANGDT